MATYKERTRLAYEKSLMYVVRNLCSEGLDDNHRKQYFAIRVQAFAEETWNSCDRKGSSRKSENDLCQKFTVSLTSTRDLRSRSSSSHPPGSRTRIASSICVDFMTLHLSEYWLGNRSSRTTIERMLTSKPWSALEEVSISKYNASSAA